MEFNLKNYLKKFEKFLPLDSQIRNVTIAAVEDVMHITLSRPQITVSGMNIFINGSSALKSEIALKQVKILARIKEIQPNLNIKKIQ